MELFVSLRSNVVIELEPNHWGRGSRQWWWRPHGAYGWFGPLRDRMACVIDASQRCGRAAKDMGWKRLDEEAA